MISTDEKTSIQARRRPGPTIPPISGRVEHEYERKGALSYMAGWDVHRAKIFGLCCPSTGSASSHNLVDLVISQEPYHSARRVFWIADNGSSHRSQAFINRLSAWHPNAILVHTPIHASWLNQVEIYFSILRRKIFTPNNFHDLVRFCAFSSSTRQPQHLFNGSSLVGTSRESLPNSALGNKGRKWQPEKYVTEFMTRTLR